MAQIVPVTSEALEAQIRELLPSQRGFGEDLQASNVIMPTIDLTAAAQGTTTPEILQTALAFGSQNTFNLSGSSGTMVSGTGFWRVTFNINAGDIGATNISLTDGLSTKIILASGTAFNGVFYHDLIIFLASGESVTGSAGGGCQIIGSARQIADINGNLVYPSGFTPE